ncbi:hypothetical protein D3C77_594670 [compost metagenome]
MSKESIVTIFIPILDVIVIIRLFFHILRMVGNLIAKSIVDFIDIFELDFSCKILLRGIYSVFQLVTMTCNNKQRNFLRSHLLISHDFLVALSFLADVNIDHLHNGFWMRVSFSDYDIGASGRFIGIKFPLSI